MKSKFLLLVIIIFFFSFPVSGEEKQLTESQPENITKTQQTKPPEPEANFINTNYTFDSILEGNPAINDFIVKNNGNATLKIERVKTG